MDPRPTIAAQLGNLMLTNIEMGAHIQQLEAQIKMLTRENADLKARTAAAPPAEPDPQG